MANFITGIRIVCATALCFCAAFSIPFYAFYITAGLSDMLDGFVARKTDSVGVFGGIFDTVADFVFAVACFIKLFPVLNVPTWLYVWVAVIATIKIINVISGFVRQKKFVAVHSVMNKITGVALFLLPFTLNVIEFAYGAIFLCVLATFSAVQEGHIIRTGKGERP